MAGIKIPHKLEVLDSAGKQSVPTIRGVYESLIETVLATAAVAGKKVNAAHHMELKNRIHALADGARAGRRIDDTQVLGEVDPAKRAVIHEWENWAALNPDDLTSPLAIMFFLTHLQQKKPGILNFQSVDKYQSVRDWLVREGRIAD